jgi:ferredoxin-nitrite reductase
VAVPVNATEALPGDGTLSIEQKEYLHGFTAGLAAANALPFVGQNAQGQLTASPSDGSQNLAAPTKWFGFDLDEITNEERLKREQNPLDIWDKMLAHASANKSPEGGDIYRFKFHGLFYVAPAQDAFMVRVRMPGNVLTSTQMRALAAIARELGGGYGDVTTRGNIQIREIAPKSIIDLLTRLSDVGLSTRGAGADNVRNITSSPLAGIDPDELIDTRPLARGLQSYLANNRDLFGLPRKFNIGFDGGGRVSVVADTNDIGFVATQVKALDGIMPGIYFRVWLAGITGHLRFAEDCGVLASAEECVAVAAAMLRVFVDHGDRTDRKKARLCYVLDRIGVAKFLALTQEKLAFPLRHVPAENCAPRLPVDKHGHLGVRPQRQADLHSIGIAIPVGHMRQEQMSALAHAADEFGSGELRTTVWQNIVLPNVHSDLLEQACATIRGIGFEFTASAIAGCVVACTGNTGCRFSATDTKGHALALMRHLDGHVKLDLPINIHLTGCPNSCAQHYAADLGLLGAQVAQGDGSIEGYHVYVGGAVEQERGLGRELAKNVPFAQLPALLQRLLTGYVAQRAAGETFVAFARRHDVATLSAMAGAVDA